MSGAPSFGNPSGVVLTMTRLLPTGQEARGPAKWGRNEVTASDDSDDDGVWKLGTGLPDEEELDTESLSLLYEDLLCVLPSSIWPLPSQNKSKETVSLSSNAAERLVFELFDFSKSELNK